MIFNIKTKRLIKYREFDRKSDPIIYCTINSNKTIEDLKHDINKNGIKNPLELWIYGLKGLLVEGNHRLVAANELNLKTLPVKIKLKFWLTGEMKKRKNRFKLIF